MQWSDRRQMSMVQSDEGSESAEAMEVEDQGSAEEKAAPVLRLYVGGLPPSTGERELRECLGRAVEGGVAVELMRSAEGHSRGYAFASVDSASDAARVMQLNNTKWRGGRLRITAAHDDYMVRLQREWAERKAKAEARPTRPASKVDGADQAVERDAAQLTKPAVELVTAPEDGVWRLKRHPERRVRPDTRRPARAQITDYSPTPHKAANDPPRTPHPKPQQDRPLRDRPSTPHAPSRAPGLRSCR